MYLEYNAEEEFYGIRDSSTGAWEVRRLPFGTRISVKIEGDWYDVTIKHHDQIRHSHGWYLVGLSLLQLDNLTASLIYTFEEV